MSKQKDHSSELRDKAARVFKYLHDVAQIRAKTVTDIDQYEEVFWFKDVPKQDGCFSIARESQEQERPDDLWLEIKKQHEPPCPPLPSVCEGWIQEDALSDSETPPKLLQQRPVYEPQDASVAIIRYEELDEHPNVQSEYEKYVATRWTPWSKEHQNWEEIQEAYSRLFAIHQNLKRLGEEFELILSIGLLTWKRGSDEKIRRHVLTAQASLEFDAAQGIFSIATGTEGAKLRLETDMLDPSIRPTQDVRQKIEEQLREATESPWNSSITFPALTAWVQSIDNRGEFDESETPPEAVDCNPRIHFAPAIVLRRRTSQNVLSMLEKIIEYFAGEEGEIPSEILRLIYDPDEFSRKFERTVGSHEGDSPKSPTPERIYFPLPANEEQERIVDLVRRRQGVLVQGPPGTGKSQTIANLICHLLATGNRVLVTAQTPRALRVLHDKIPRGIAPLCVSLLGNDRAALEGLEHSVGAISNQHSNWDPLFNAEEIESLEAELTKKQGELATLHKHSRDLSERECRTHVVADNVYSGTAQQIATRLARQEQENAWFEDRIPYDKPLPFKPSNLQVLRSNLVKVPPARLAELKKHWPDPSGMFTPDAFAKLCGLERKLAHAELAINDLGNNVNATALQACDETALKQLSQKVSHLVKVLRENERNLAPWVSEAVHEILRKQTDQLQVLNNTSKELLGGLEERVRNADRLRIEAPNEVTLTQLLADATDLLSHLDSGKGMGVLFLRPAIVKRTRYLWELVRVDGKLCNTQETIRQLITVLQAQKAVDQLWQLWHGRLVRKSGPLTLQLSLINEQVKRLESVLSIREALDACEQAWSMIQGLVDPHCWEADAASLLLSHCEAAIECRQLQKVRNEISAHIEPIARFASLADSHPICKRVLEALQKRDQKEYTSIYKILTDMKADLDRANRTFKALAELNNLAPIFASQLEANPDSPEWGERLPKFSDAWNWSRGQSWLEWFSSEDRSERIERDIERISREIGDIKEKLAAGRAWKCFFERLTESQRQHLVAWQQAIKKIGKGTGKYAQHHRKNAQDHLDKCRVAIPAWIMPLYRVFETISPKAGAFDVVIVDEASQCGPEAIVLLFLAKKVIVVGDDQQISPAAVGIDQQEIQVLMRQHLDGLDHIDSFGVTSSLFDHAVIRYGNRIVLREHFRCMPEIIRFSNDLCYVNNPLIPLRQYPPHRLRPIVTHYVASGHREGGVNAFNVPEAESLVAAVVACCRDPEYKGKSMGVISLQGQTQARLIESLLLEHLDPKEIEERRIICGDSYSFQGDERHVVFLSMVAAPNSRFAPLTKDSDKQRFNVAASRAQDQLWLFHSVTLDELSPQCFRYRLLKHALNPLSNQMAFEGLDIDQLRHQLLRADHSSEKPPPPFESWFELEVFSRIIGRGYRVIPQYNVAGYRIDLVVEGMSSRLAVECDGDMWHGVEAYEKDKARQRQLERCGWRFWRIRGSRFFLCPDKSLETLWAELSARRIEPYQIASQSNEIDGHFPAIDWTKQLVEQVPMPPADESLAVEQEKVFTECDEDESGQSGPAVIPQRKKLQKAEIEVVVEHRPVHASEGPMELVIETPPTRARKLSRESRNDDGLIEQAMNIDSDVWFSMSHWAKENDQLDGRGRRMLYDMGRKKRRNQVLTSRQAMYAMALYDKVIALGFQLPEPETKGQGPIVAI